MNWVERTSTPGPDLGSGTVVGMRSQWTWYWYYDGGTGNGAYGLGAGSKAHTREIVWLECENGVVVNNERYRNRDITGPMVGCMNETLDQEVKKAK